MSDIRGKTLHHSTRNATLDRRSAARACAAFNSKGMYRGWIGPDGEPHVAIYRNWRWNAGVAADTAPARRGR
jgi:hypothetical protein